MYAGAAVVLLVCLIARRPGVRRRMETQVDWNIVGKGEVR